MQISEWRVHDRDPASDYRSIKRFITAQVDYGMVDKKGRRLGCELIIEERVARPEYKEQCCTYPAIVGGYYTGVQATRGGATFGASFPKMLPAASLEEAKASLLKRAAQSCKRAKKNAV